MTKPVKLTDQHRKSIEDFRSQHKTGLLALLFTDIVGSTAIKQEIGDEAGNALIIKHNETVRQLLKEFPEGAEISTAGDSFFTAFVRPSDAVRFSLLLHARLREMSSETMKPVTIRIGIHMGEVHIIEESDGMGMRDILGLQVDIAARIMSLAEGGQILMSRGVFDNARSVLKSEDIPAIKSISWLNHGPYTLKGVEEPQDIAEVGEEGIAPLSSPPDSDKAKSIAPIDGNLVVGWRPSPGADIPTAPGWILFEKLGEGGFGEVWRAQKTKEPDEDSLATEMETLNALPIGSTVAFKFCFDIAHARALKREATLFKLLQKKQGELKHTVKMLDYQITEAPLFLAMEFIQGKNLAQWLKEEGAAIKPIKRLQMMAPVAQSIHDIHKAGIIINDIKPSNILVRVAEGGKLEFLLTDLGIGQIRDKKFIDEVNHTRTTGFTKTSLTMVSGSYGAAAGSLLYLAPELLEGGKPSIASDAYALGVTLMQVAAGNPKLAVSDAWKKRVHPHTSCCLIGKLIRGESEKRTDDLYNVSNKLNRLPRKALFRSIRTASIFGLITFVSFFFGYRCFSVTPKIKSVVEQEKENVTALGIAVDLQSFHNKYAPTKEGETAILEASQLLKRLPSYDDKLLAPSFSTRSIHTVQIRNKKMKMNFLGEAMSHAVGASRRDYQSMQYVVEDSNAIVQEILSLSRGIPYRDLNSFHLPGEESPFPKDIRVLGTRDNVIPHYLRIRQSYQRILPVVLYWTIDKGDIDKAYEILYSWIYLSKSIKAGSGELVCSMMGFFCEHTCLQYCLAMLKTFPPSSATAQRLIDIIDPAYGEIEYVRLLEMHLLDSLSAIRWFRGDIEVWPRILSSKEFTSPIERRDMFSNFGYYSNVKPWSPPKSFAWVYRLKNNPDKFLYNNRHFIQPELWYVESVYYSQIKDQFRDFYDRSQESDKMKDTLSYPHLFFSKSSPVVLYFKNKESPQGLNNYICKYLSQRSLLKSSLLLRIAELDANGDFSKMPKTLAPLFAAQGDPPPLDYLGETLESQIEYIPNPKDGTYILRHSASSPNGEPFEFLGQWDPESTVPSPPEKENSVKSFLQFLIEVNRTATTDWQVDIWFDIDNPIKRAFRLGEEVPFKILPHQEGYLAVIAFDAEFNASLLYPNIRLYNLGQTKNMSQTKNIYYEPTHTQEKVTAGKEIRYPPNESSDKLRIGEPLGKERIVVLLTPEPIIQLVSAKKWNAVIRNLSTFEEWAQSELMYTSSR